jgi:hypothetical protein
MEAAVQQHFKDKFSHFKVTMSAYRTSMYFKLSPKETKDTQPRDGGRKPQRGSTYT